MLNDSDYFDEPAVENNKKVLSDVKHGRKTKVTICSLAVCIAVGVLIFINMFEIAEYEESKHH